MATIRLREALDGVRSAARAAEAAGVAVQMRSAAMPLASPARVRAILDGVTADLAPGG